MSRTFGMPGVQPPTPAGAGDQISIAPAASINNLSAFTYAAWIFWFGTNSFDFYIICVKDAPASYYPSLGILDVPAVQDQTIEAAVRTTNGVFTSDTSNFTITPNAWHRVAMTYDDAGTRQIRIYIDGVEPTYQQQNTATGVLIDNSVGAQLVGTDLLGDIFQGYIGEFKIWNVALTPAQIASDFAGTPVLPANNVCWLHLCGRQNPEPDVSGNGNVGMATGAPAGPDTPFGQCSFLAEENGFVPMSSISSKQKITIFGG
jgi:hypothetical protein